MNKYIKSIINVNKLLRFSKLNINKYQKCLDS